MKNVACFFCILLHVFISKDNLLVAQIPSRDNFQFVFENDLENDQLGNYLLSDWRTDWNQTSSATLPSKADIDILSENNSRFMRGFLKGGTYQPANHGWYWNSKLKQKHKELYISYDIRFKPGFQWVIGGKMPYGISGGPIASGASPTESSGWTVRTMWKEDGRLVFYVYHQDRAMQYGSTWPWGTFKFVSGTWYNLTIRVVVNTFINGVAQSNGILEGFIDGKLLFQKSGIKFRSMESYDIDNMILSAFFGGNTPEWAAIRDEWIDTDNYIAFAYSNNASNVTTGNRLSASNTVLLHPYRNFSSGMVKSSMPAAPSALTSTGITANSVNLKWTDNSLTEQGFKIEARNESDTTFRQIATVSANVENYIHINPGKTYQYRVKAFNEGGESGYSNIYEAKGSSSVAFPIDRNSVINIFPNPFNDRFTISSADLIKTVEILDITGSEIFHEITVNQETYMVEKLPEEKGTYLLKVLLQNGKTQIIKVLKK